MEGNERKHFEVTLERDDPKLVIVRIGGELDLLGANIFRAFCQSEVFQPHVGARRLLIDAYDLHWLERAGVECFEELVERREKIGLKDPRLTLFYQSDQIHRVIQVCGEVAKRYHLIAYPAITN